MRQLQMQQQGVCWGQARSLGFQSFLGYSQLRTWNRSVSRYWLCSAQLEAVSHKGITVQMGTDNQTDPCVVSSVCIDHSSQCCTVSPVSPHSVLYSDTIVQDCVPQSNIAMDRNLCSCEHAFVVVTCPLIIRLAVYVA